MSVVNFMDVIESVENNKDMEIFEGKDIEELSNGFEIKDDEQADRFLRWYISCVNNIDSNRDKANEALKYYEAKVNDWLKEVNRIYVNNADFIKYALEKYMFKKYTDNGNKNVTLKLFNGNIKYNRPKAKPVYENEDAVIKFLKENDRNDLIVTKESINKVNFKKAGEVDGENLIINGNAVPGFKFEEQPLELKLPDGEAIKHDDVFIFTDDCDDYDDIPF